LPVLSVSLSTGVEERDFSEERIQPKMSDFANYKVARRGQVVFNKMRMWQGAVGVAPVDGFVSPDYTVLEPLDGVNAVFFSALFKTPGYTCEVNRYSHGIALDRNRIYWDGFKAITSPVPPFEEQCAIAAFLDRRTAAIDDLIAKKGRLIELLQEKRQALITQAVTKGLDPNVPMKDSGVPELGPIPEAWAAGQLGRFIKLQRGIDITGAADVEVGAPVISSGGFLGRCRRAFALGPGVVIGRKGTLGTVYYVAEDYWPHDTTLWVREFRGSDPKYVFYFLRHMQLERLDSGAANPTLNRNVVHPLKVAWPDIASQRRISEWLDDRLAVLDRAVEAFSKSVVILREFRQALISAAVTGKIDIPAEEAA